MIFEHSHISHRLIGSLEEGEELVEVLTALCKKNNVYAAEIRAVGSFQNVELVRFDRQSKQYAEVLNGNGDFELISLQGNVSMMGSELVLRLDGLLSVNGLLGQQIVAGQIRSARVNDCEFVVDVFTDVRVSRRLDAQRGLLVMDSISRIETQPAAPAATAVAAAAVATATTERMEALRAPFEKPASQAYSSPQSQNTQPAAPVAPAPVVTPAAAPASSMSWSDAIAKSDEAKSSARQAPRIGDRRTAAPSSYNFDDEEDEPTMSPGDILDHPKLRRCLVMKVEDDDYAHIRLPSGKIRKLALAVCEIVYKGEEDGRKIFSVRIGK